MRNLAVLSCSECERSYYGDMPTGHGIYYPVLLEPETGQIHHGPTGDWFAEFLKQGYAERSEKRIPIRVDQRSSVSLPVLVNALDGVYIHSVSKLLNSQYLLDEHPERDVIVLVPEVVEWLVPDDIDEVWVVDRSLSEGHFWNDWLAGWIRSKLEDYDDVQLCVTFPHVHQDDFDIERFTGVSPFPVEEWEDRLSEPTVTIIWRNIPEGGSVSRLWCSLPDSADYSRRVRGYVNLIGEKLGVTELGLREQRQNVITTAETLRGIFDNIDIAVAGIGTPGGLPKWIADLRVEDPSDYEQIELCRRYAKSHVIVGPHGSQMSLPSAHAGGVVNVLPGWKRGNIGGDMKLRRCGQQETIYTYRHVPASVPASDVAREVAHLLVDWPQRKIRTGREYCNHEMDVDRLYDIRDMEAKRYQTVSENADEPRTQLGSNLARTMYESLTNITNKLR